MCDAQPCGFVNMLTLVSRSFVNTDFARRAALLPWFPCEVGGSGVGREETRGVQGWVLPSVVVEHIESRRFGLNAAAAAGTKTRDAAGAAAQGLWSRSYGNYPLYLLKMAKTTMGLYPVRAPNALNLSHHRQQLSHSAALSLAGGIGGDLDVPGGAAGADWQIYHHDEGRSVFAAHLSASQLRAASAAACCPRPLSDSKPDRLTETGRGWGGTQRQERNIAMIEVLLFDHSHVDQEDQAQDRAGELSAAAQVVRGVVGWASQAGEAAPAQGNATQGSWRVVRALRPLCGEAQTCLHRNLVCLVACGAERAWQAARLYLRLSPCMSHKRLRQSGMRMFARHVSASRIAP